MARRLTKRSKIILSGCVHPDYRATTRTYLSGDETPGCLDVPIGDDGRADLGAIESALDDDIAAVIVGYPSFFGPLADLRPIAEAAHARGALLATACAEPYALAIAESPGAQGADIAVGEGQALACPPQFGGPGVGLLACRQDRHYLQQLPGRVAGETVDSAGKPGFVLTLSTREQHIRRERATSNICTNQGLLALSLAIRTSLLGKKGFVEVAEQCFAKAAYLKERIVSLDGFSSAFTDAPFFNEFAVRSQRATAAALCEKLEAEGIIAGFDLGRVDAAQRDLLLIAVTELHDRQALDRFADALSRA
jgi:glycine dehydrogenase subunit 1